MYCAALAVSSSFMEKATESSSFFIPSAKASPSGKVNAGLIPTVINPPKSPEITFSITGFTSFRFRNVLGVDLPHHNNTSKCVIDGSTSA